MHKGVGGVRLGGEVVRAQENTTIVLVTAGELTVAVTALYFRLGEFAAAALEVFKHELDCRISVFWRGGLMSLVCRQLSVSASGLGKSTGLTLRELHREISCIGRVPRR